MRVLGTVCGATTNNPNYFQLFCAISIKNSPEFMGPISL